MGDMLGMLNSIRFIYVAIRVLIVLHDSRDLMPVPYIWIRSGVIFLKPGSCITVAFLVICLICSTIASIIVEPVVAELTSAGRFESCGRCPRSFDSLGSSLLTFQTWLVG